KRHFMSNVGKGSETRICHAQRIEPVATELNEINLLLAAVTIERTYESGRVELFPRSNRAHVGGPPTLQRRTKNAKWPFAYHHATEVSDKDRKSRRLNSSHRT